MTEYIFFLNVQSGAVGGGKSSGTAQQVSSSLKLSEAGHSVHGGEAAQCQNSMQKKSGTMTKFLKFHSQFVHTLSKKVV